MFQPTSDRILLDVRSPGEYAQGHIVGARSLPLFSDVERAEVGTAYKQEGPEPAFLLGLERSGPKMRAYVERALTLAPGRRVTVHCWRGGQRSGSMGWLLERAGFDVEILPGGYKAYRTEARAWLGKFPHQLRLLCGPTGSGKTAVLHALRAQGASILDLEGMAHHRGSSFGAIGQEPQPGSEHFENLLYAALRELPEDRPVWVEDESRLIGTVCLPDTFWDRLSAAPLYQLEPAFEDRVQHLVTDYADFPNEQLAAAFERIGKRLGGQHLKAALEALDTGDYAAAARIALVYYDKTYRHSFERRGREGIATLTYQNQPAEWVAERLREL